MEIRKFIAELVGTALLVIFAVGTATLSFGFKLIGNSFAAGIVTTALAFGLVLLALVYTIGPISGCHVNPAVTIGFVASRRMSIAEGLEYWIAQFIGGILGALILWAIMEGSPLYSTKNQGLGADGFGRLSQIRINAVGAFATEVVLTFLFVLVVLTVTSRVGVPPGFAALAIGFALATAHLVGIAITGTSVNPARSLGPALIVGGLALSQVWLFIIAPLVGGIIAALCFAFLIAHPAATQEATGPTTVAAVVVEEG